MQIFIDSGNLEKIRELNDLGVIDGVTTNPSLVSRENKPFRQLIKEICMIVDGPVSAETVSEDFDGMMKEAVELSKIHKNVIVKIVNTPQGIKAVKECTRRGIKTNVTLTFSAVQALLAAKAGATYVSPFVGRLDDVKEDGMQLVRDIRQIFDNYDFGAKILVASVRSTGHVLEAAKIGADVATCPAEVIENLFKHPLTDAGIKKFLDDWKKVRDKGLDK
ncbi:MAG: fructose-6-phosphate aldolase [Candidatus Diapherotrites archaeon]|nr:fructose-6-phosphate aldolase [Candidatus Diapherotrites archaeon]